ncbi:MAG: photosystem II S4 domain protein [Limnochordales bacterium]|nr:photosystem II S4 domain protein [Limnochordales bacterium]
MDALVTGDEESRVTEMVQEARRRAEALQEPQATGFIAPEFRPLAQALLDGAAGLLHRWEGGYAGAARCRLHIYPDYLPEEDLPSILAAVEARLAVEAEDSLEEDGQGTVKVDWEAALRATGIAGEKLGDLLPQEDGRSCQLVVAPEAVEEVLARWRRAGRWPVQISLIDVEALAPPNQRRKEIRAFVASLRLDAVAAAGFALSRSRMAREIRTARVKLNWKLQDDPAHPVKVGDTISLRGRGRVVVEALEGSSRKGRTVVRLVRYL